MKTNKEKVVEILKEANGMAYYDFDFTAEKIDQLYSSGEEVSVLTEPLDRFCPHLTPKAMMYWKEGAEFMRDRIKKPTRSVVTDSEFNPNVTGSAMNMICPACNGNKTVIVTRSY